MRCLVWLIPDADVLGAELLGLAAFGAVVVESEGLVSV
jgi:hypothetical protein